jgi:alpha 1,6-mannosyltransferase
MIEYRNIFQTDKDAAPEAKKKWEAKNAADGWSVDFYDDERAQGWMEDNFAGSGVEWAWDFMKRGVLRADFLRYMLPLVKGGVYVDVDVSFI